MFDAAESLENALKKKDKKKEEKSRALLAELQKEMAEQIKARKSRL